MHREMHSYKKCQFSLVFVKVPKFLMHVCISIFFFKRGIIFGASKSYDHFFFCQQPYHGSSKSHRFRQRKAFGSKFDNQNGFPFSGLCGCNLPARDVVTSVCAHWHVRYRGPCQGLCWVTGVGLGQGLSLIYLPTKPKPHPNLEPPPMCAEEVRDGWWGW